MTTRYRPPVVAYAVERPLWAGRAFVGCWLVLVAVMLAWALQPQAFWQRGTAALFLLLAAFLLRRQYALWPAGRLLWDGEQWWFGPGDAWAAVAAEPQGIRLHVALDGGSWLWLEVRAEGLPARGWLERSRRHRFHVWERQSPGRWGDLRRAVYWPVAQRPGSA